MHFINLLGENDTEIVILTHQIKSLLIDIILPRLPILRVVVDGLASLTRSPIEILRGACCRLAFDTLFVV
jgi:hypothetical protein